MLLIHSITLKEEEEGQTNQMEPACAYDTAISSIKLSSLSEKIMTER